jgi:hypothetical protein
VQPTYLSWASTGAGSSTPSSPWRITNWQAKAPQIHAFQVVVSSTGPNWQIDVTLDDPTGTFPNPVNAVTVWSASAIGGPSAGTGNAIGYINNPIAAYRLTLSSTTAQGSAVLTTMVFGVG